MFEKTKKAFQENSGIFKHSRNVILSAPRPGFFKGKMKLLFQKIQNSAGPSLTRLLKGFEKAQPMIRKKKPLFVALILAFLISDLLILESHKLLLPEKSVPPLKLPPPARSAVSKNYETIWEKNIFHPGPIPAGLISKIEPSGKPVKTSLPFTLKGTIVHADPERSVATVKDRKETKAYKSGDIIANQARIIEIQRRKIIFFNQNNNLTEFLQLPESVPVTLSFNRPRRRDPVQTSLVKKAGNTFEVKRSRINEYLQKLPEILRQARMIPHKVKKDGVMVIEGFRFESIKEEALWLKDLGFQKGDIIKQVDGEPINTPETAIALFEKLRDSDGFEMVVQREGKTIKRNYTVDWDSQ